MESVRVHREAISDVVTLTQLAKLKLNEEQSKEMVTILENFAT